MRPSLILQPIHNSSVDILKTFAEAKPLTPDQVNYLDWHQHELSTPEFDPVLQYYLKNYANHGQDVKTSFLLPHEIMNLESIVLLKKRLKSMLENKKSRVSIAVTQPQFEAFKRYGIHELIFYHGNQLLTGAPFYEGGLAPVIYFQWGNFFGVVKYVVLYGEKALKANLLIYFEDIQDRTLDQCVKTYEAKLEKDIAKQDEILLEHKIEPQRFNNFLIKPPTPY